MANYGTLKAAIDAYIKRNGQQRITGDLLNAVLNAAVDALGMGYQFLGIATAATDPGTPDARVFYLAGAGTYPNFGSTEIPEGSIGIFCYGDTWEYEVLQVGSGGGGSENAVLYTPQTLTTEQKEQARSNIGAGVGNYSKPSGGIPSTDLAEGVRTSLGKADTALQSQAQANWDEVDDTKADFIKNKPTIPAEQVNADWNAVSGKAQILNKPTIPAEQVNSDWNSSSGKSEILNKPSIPQNVVQYTSQSLTTEQKEQARTNIGAGTYSKPATGIPDSDLASGVQASLGKADTAYQLPQGGIPSTDMASAVTTSLGKADSAVQMSDLLALAETWTFTLDDDSVVTKKIIVLPTT